MSASETLAEKIILPMVMDLWRTFERVFGDVPHSGDCDGCIRKMTPEMIMILMGITLGIRPDSGVVLLTKGMFEGLCADYVVVVMSTIAQTGLESRLLEDEEDPDEAIKEYDYDWISNISDAIYEFTHGSS